MIFNPGILVTVGLSLFALFAFWQSDRAIQRSKGAAAEAAKIEQRSTVNAAKANAARRSAAQLPDNSLRDARFRD